MFLRIVILSVSVLLCPIAKSMDVSDEPSKINYDYTPKKSSDWLATHHPNAIATVALYPPQVTDPFSTIIQTIKPSWLGRMIGKGVYGPIDNNVLTNLKRINFTGIIVVLTHQDTSDNSDQMHVLNINSNKCIVRMWCEEDCFEESKYKLPIICKDREHELITINSGNYYLFVTTPDAENQLRSGFKQIIKKEAGFKNKLLFKVCKIASKGFNEEMFNAVLKSFIERNSTNTSDALDELNTIAKQSKEKCSPGLKMLLHIKK